MSLETYSSVVDIQLRNEWHLFVKCFIVFVLLFVKELFYTKRKCKKKIIRCVHLLSQELPWSCGRGLDASTKAFVARWALPTESLGLITQQPGRAPQCNAGMRNVEIENEMKLHCHFNSNTSPRIALAVNSFICSLDEAGLSMIGLH